MLTSLILPSSLLLRFSSAAILQQKLKHITTIHSSDRDMRPTVRLLQACRITLFTRENCGLCSDARSILSDVWDTRPFQFKEIDIVKSDNGPQWRELYDFDVPVIHISQSSAPEEQPRRVSEAVRLMHRFTTEQVKAKMDEVEKA